MKRFCSAVVMVVLLSMPLFAQRSRSGYKFVQEPPSIIRQILYNPWSLSIYCRFFTDLPACAEN